MMKSWWNRIGIGNRAWRGAPEGKSFRESQEKEEAFDIRDRVRRRVPLNRIVGSVGRYHDFDSQFRLKQHVPSDRLQAVRKAMREGRAMPPVELYQIKDEYYVVDGNHRIAAAKESGRQDIDACIVELIPSKNTLENILYREKTDFADRTGLAQAPELTEVEQYKHLLRQISRHRHFLSHEQGGPVTFQTAAADWHKTIYAPLISIIRKEHLLDSFPGRTTADLYAYIALHQWDKGRQRKYGIKIDRLVPKDMEAFRQKMAALKESEYPEMHQGITAFVLMHVKASREYRIIERLFALREVQEIHSVHGDVDVIAKLVLTRDLLSSDSEIIGHFVHEKIRKIPGVISTQTLIPGYSKIKEDCSS
jgi:DNA-binding Lrp family transcriptional regulator